MSRALELGIGTGRIALPLARRGVPVHGIDLSRAMVARLRAKPGGDRIGVTIGDFATARVDSTFTLAYLVFNTITNLTTQEAQVACFRTVAAHLEPGGCFVIEVRVPELRRLPPGQDVLPRHVSRERIVYSYDTATQGMRGHYVERGEYSTIPFWYVWSAELNLMAQLAGIRLRAGRGRLCPAFRRAVELGIMRNHYVGRTFIQPTQAIRESGVKMKHNANRIAIEGKRIILIGQTRWCTAPPRRRSCA